MAKVMPERFVALHPNHRLDAEGRLILCGRCQRTATIHNEAGHWCRPHTDPNSPPICSVTDHIASSSDPAYSDPQGR